MFEAYEGNPKELKYWKEVLKRANIKRRLKKKDDLVIWNGEHVGCRTRKNDTDIEKAQRLAHEVRQRDGFECQRCGSLYELEVHHKIPVSVRPGLQYDKDNMITLCKTCHKKTHREFWKVKYNKTI